MMYWTVPLVLPYLMVPLPVILLGIGSYNGKICFIDSLIDALGTRQLPLLMPKEGSGLVF